MHTLTRSAGSSNAVQVGLFLARVVLVGVLSALFCIDLFPFAFFPFGAASKADSAFKEQLEARTTFDTESGFFTLASAVHHSFKGQTMQPGLLLSQKGVATFNINVGYRCVWLETCR